MEVPNQQPITDSASVLPGVELPRGQLTVLNRFCDGAGPCRSSVYKWGYAASPLFDCGEVHTIGFGDHIINHCDLTALIGCLRALKNCTEKWLKDLRDSVG